MKTLIIAFLFLICAVTLPTYSQTPSCQQDAENQPCNESWQVNEKLVWVNLPGRLDCKIPVSVFYFYRCNVFRLGWYQFASIPSSFEQPPGCSNNKDDYYAAMQSAQFQESALTTAIGEHLNYTSPGLPICGVGVPAQALIYTATCYRMVIEYQSFAGSTVTMNYNPALGYQHYEQLMQQYNVVLPPYSVKVLPCGYTCCKQTVSYCKQPPSLAVVTMYGPKVNLSGYCDTDPELFCQTRTCE